MLIQIKFLIKKLLASIGLFHPSLGIKISPEAKATIILEHKTPKLRVFVETGTHKGWMIEKMIDHFEKIYSIELDPSLYNQALERFKGQNKIELLYGNSAMEIKKILAKLDEPALFWLDAHDSGAITSSNAPIVDELKAIFTHPIKNHFILIDDARHFDLSTISLIKKLTKANGYKFVIKDGIFRLYGE